MRDIRMTRYGLVVLLLAMLLMPACGSKEEKVASFLARGDRLLNEGDPVRASLEYKNALQMDAKNVPAIMGLARVHLAQNEYQRAYTDLKAALEINRDLDEARIELASLLIMGKAPEQALMELAQLKSPEARRSRVTLLKARGLAAMERYPEAIETLSSMADGDGSKEVQALLALALKKTGAWDSMEAAVQGWRELDPVDTSSYLFLAQYAMERGERDRAARELKSMLEANPGDVERAVLRAQALERIGFTRDAELAFEEIPDRVDVNRARADFWIRQGNRPKALAVLEKLVRSDPADIAATIQLAQVLVDEKQGKSAFQYLDHLLKRDLKKPERERVLLAKATLLAGMGDWKEARHIGEAVLAENQGSTEGHMLLGRILLATQKYGEAEIHLNQAVANRPRDEEAQVLLARSQLINRKETLAGDTLRRALEAKPESNRLRMELVRTCVGRRDYEQAARILDGGLELQPDNIQILKVRGKLELMQGRPSKAMRYFQQIVELRPDLPMGYMEMGQLTMAQSRYDEAQRHFQSALERENGWQSAVPALIRVHLAKGEHKSALNLARDTVEGHSDSPLSHYFLAQVLEETGDPAGAEKSLLKAAALAPQWQEPYSALADLYGQQGRIAQVIEELEQSYKQQPSSPTLMELAALYEFDQRYGDAIRIYRDLLEKTAESPILLNNLAFLYAESARDDTTLAQAGELANRALSMQPENPSFLDTAAWIAYRKGDQNAAWSYIQDALMMAPDNGVHNLHAAIILNERGMRDEAVGHLVRAMREKMDARSEQRALALKAEWKVVN